MKLIKLNVHTLYSERIDKLLKVCNILYFDGKLDVSNIQYYYVVNSSIICGLKESENPKNFVFMINPFYEDFHLIKNVIVHELIHIHQLQVLGLSWDEILDENPTGHGKSFLDKAFEIKEKYKIDTYKDIYEEAREFKRYKERQLA